MAVLGAAGRMSTEVPLIALKTFDLQTHYHSDSSVASEAATVPRLGNGGFFVSVPDIDFPAGSDSGYLWYLPDRTHAA